MADMTEYNNITDIHNSSKQLATPETSLCHTCRTHHALVRSMLSSYYTASCTPAQEAALDEALPAYTASIAHRYPPLCSVCAPKADQCIRKADTLARREMWGGWLDRSRQVTPANHVKQRSEVVWAIRGSAWVLSTIAGLIMTATAAASNPMPRLARYLLYSTIPSLLWAFWDPLWLQASRARRRTGAERVKLQGREAWICSQAVVLGCRVIVSTIVLATGRSESMSLDAGFCARSFISVALTFLLVAQLSLLASSYSGLSLQAPIRMRLVTTSIPADTTSQTSSQAKIENRTTAKDPLSALSLASEDPVSLLKSAPVPHVGQPSLPLDELLVPTPRRRVGLSPSPEPVLEEMDWTPAMASATKVISPPRAWPSSSADFQLGPQRFFPPEAPTGLDDAFSQALDFKRADSSSTRTGPRSLSDVRRERLGRERRARKLSARLALAIAAAGVLLSLRGNTSTVFDLASIREIWRGQGDSLQAQTPLEPAYFEPQQTWQPIVVTYLAAPPRATQSADTGPSQTPQTTSQTTSSGEEQLAW